jgi:hypothetical protein
VVTRDDDDRSKRLGQGESDPAQLHRFDVERLTRRDQGKPRRFRSNPADNTIAVTGFAVENSAYTAGLGFSWAEGIPPEMDAKIAP